MCRTLASWPLIKMSCSVTERVAENRPAASSCRLRGSSATSLNTPPSSKETQSSTTASGPLRQKPCCLCWCCCCSCTCSPPGKGNDESGQAKSVNNSDSLSHDSDPPPSSEEVRSWGRSFDRLMRSPAGRKVFREFLRCEYSEENMLFWLACEDLKKETNPEVILHKAHAIYDDYVSVVSPKEVSLDSRVRDIVNRNMQQPTSHMYDEAQLQIYTLMQRDSYPRFANSAQYKTLLQQLGPDTDGVDGNGQHG